MNEKPMTVVATSLKLRGWMQLRRFFKLNGAIKRQLNVSSGLLQYSPRQISAVAFFYVICLDQRPSR